MKTSGATDVLLNSTSEVKFLMWEPILGISPCPSPEVWTSSIMATSGPVISWRKRILCSLIKWFWFPQFLWSGKIWEA